jgi:RNA polymerase sigma-70 factor (ECF subfamily)
MGGHSPAEPGLVEDARAGDSEAQQQLWRLHRRWVAAIIMVHRPRTVEVDDLMQDVAIRYISKLPTLRDPEAFRPWLRRIVINVCRGAARGLKPTLHLVDGDRHDEGAGGRSDVAPVPARGDDGVLEQREDARRLLDHVMTLPSDYREPLLLRCVRSMSYQQISEILELPITTIETRLARARRMLREELESKSNTA